MGSYLYFKKSEVLVRVRESTDVGDLSPLFPTFHLDISIIRHFYDLFNPGLCINEKIIDE